MLEYNIKRQIKKSVFDSNTDISDSNPVISDSNTVISDSNTVISDSDTDISDSDTDISDSDTDISDSGKDFLEPEFPVLAALQTGAGAEAAGCEAGFRLCRGARQAISRQRDSVSIKHAVSREQGG
ncbi:MAG: hypothetical protein LBD48_06115 [Treponema sp.]|jgi:hypothetical protein|nr:hypothetical protein [Treponema sp.]